MNTPLLMLRQECIKTADDYREALLDWIIASRAPQQGSECLAQAIIYREALEKLLTCLNALESTKGMADEIARMEKNLEFLAAEMNRGYRF
jgi:hypothetical protein